MIAEMSAGAEQRCACGNALRVWRSEAGAERATEVWAVDLADLVAYQGRRPTRHRHPGPPGAPPATRAVRRARGHTTPVSHRPQRFDLEFSGAPAALAPILPTPRQ